MAIKSIACLASVFAVFAVAPCSATGGSGPYEFAASFIQTLEHLESIRDNAERDMKKEDTMGHLTGCVRNMEAFQLELSTDIPIMKAIQLSGEAKGTPQQFAQFFEFKRNLYRDLQANCSQMVQAPHPGVDYGALAAEAPKINARLDYIDDSIFKATPLVFAALVGANPDAQGHMSHLSITKAQMYFLARSIKLGFGSKLDLKNPNYTVSAASLLYFYLTKKGYKGSDEK